MFVDSILHEFINFALVIFFLFLICKKIFPTKTLLTEKIIFTITNIIFILLTTLAFYTYTSSFPVLPWHDSGGMQFLIIYVIYAPWMLITGFLQLFISKHLNISITTKLIPFISAIILTSILFIGFGDGISIFVRITGSLICLISIGLTGFYAIKDFSLMKNQINF